MKANLWLFLSLFFASGIVGGRAEAAMPLRGSDTLAGVMADAIVSADLTTELVYVDGGSATGESALLKGSQGLAPLSRPLSENALRQGRGRGLEFIDHVIGLDGIGVYVNTANPVRGLDFPLLQKIFTCQVTDWRDIPGAPRGGPIHAFRRDDESGTTDLFQSMVGIKKFGACVTVAAKTRNIAEVTAGDSAAIGFSGRPALRDRNKCVKISAGGGSAFVELTAHTVRGFSYPLTRILHIYEVKGAVKEGSAQARFLRKLLSRDFLDPILRNNEFFPLN